MKRSDLSGSRKRVVGILSHGQRGMILTTNEDEVWILERDESGASTGWLTGEVAAITALWERLPKPGLEEAISSTRESLPRPSALNAAASAETRVSAARPAQPDGPEVMVLMTRESRGLAERLADGMALGLDLE